MSTFACEQCGRNASVILTKAPPNRGRPQPPPIVHHYCRECATLLGVPLLDRNALPPEIANGLGIWTDIEMMLAHIQRDIQTSLAAGGMAAKAAAHLVEIYPGLPGPMPARIRDAFARIGLPMRNDGR